MDAEIHELLRSLNIEGSPSAHSVPHSPASSPVAIARPQKRWSLYQWLKKHELLVFWTGGCLLVLKISLVTFFFFRGVPENWVVRARRVVRVYEPVISEKMTTVCLPLQSVGLWSANDLQCHTLPEGDRLQRQAVACLEILEAADERKKALEEIRHDVDACMIGCIHAPDMIHREGLHRALARFDAADVTLTQGLVPLIQAKRVASQTAEDHQNLDEALVLVGLGKGLEGYSVATARIASTKERIGNLTEKLRKGRDVVLLAETLKSTFELLDDVQKDSFVASYIDVDTKRHEAIELCRSAVRETLQQLPTCVFPRRCTNDERFSIAYLQGYFPDIETVQWTKIDGLLGVLDGPSRCAVLAENNLSPEIYSSAIVRVLMAPEPIAYVDNN